MIQEVEPEHKDMTNIYFRIPHGKAEHKLEISVSAGISDSGQYQSACIFTVVKPVDTESVLEPCFPEVHHAFHSHGLHFPVALPTGHLILSEQNLVKCRIFAP